MCLAYSSCLVSFLCFCFGLLLLYPGFVLLSLFVCVFHSLCLAFLFFLFVAFVSLCCVVVCMRVFLLLCVVWPVCNDLVVSRLLLFLLYVFVFSVYCVWHVRLVWFRVCVSFCFVFVICTLFRFVCFVVFGFGMFSFFVLSVWFVFVLGVLFPLVVFGVCSS